MVHRFFYNDIYKPDSVISDKSKTFIIYLFCLPLLASLMQICASNTLDKSNQNIHDISTRKVYPSQDLHLASVSSYLTFSPLLRCTHRSGLAFCGTFYHRYINRSPFITWYVTLRCPDFPYFKFKSEIR